MENRPDTFCALVGAAAIGTLAVTHFCKSSRTPHYAPTECSARKVTFEEPDSVSARVATTMPAPAPVPVTAAPPATSRADPFASLFGMSAEGEQAMSKTAMPNPDSAKVKAARKELAPALHLESNFTKSVGQGILMPGRAANLEKKPKRSGKNNDMFNLPEALAEQIRQDEL